MSPLNSDKDEKALDTIGLICRSETEAEKMRDALIEWFSKESGFKGVNVAVVATEGKKYEIRIICSKVGGRFSGELVVEDIEMDSLSAKLAAINFRSPRRTILMVGWVDGEVARFVPPSEHERYAILESISFHRMD